MQVCWDSFRYQDPTWTLFKERVEEMQRTESLVEDKKSNLLSCDQVVNSWMWRSCYKLILLGMCALANTAPCRMTLRCSKMLSQVWRPDESLCWQPHCINGLSPFKSMRGLCFFMSDSTQLNLDLARVLGQISVITNWEDLLNLLVMAMTRAYNLTKKKNNNKQTLIREKNMFSRLYLIAVDQLSNFIGKR